MSESENNTSENHVSNSENNTSENRTSNPEIDKFGQEKPEFYGFMLSANEKIQDAGGALTRHMLIVALGICVVLHMGWLEDIFRTDLNSYKSWIVYIFILSIAFSLSRSIISLKKNAAFQSIRPELEDYLFRDGMTRYQILAVIEGAGGLSAISEKIKEINERP